LLSENENTEPDKTHLVEEGSSNAVQPFFMFGGETEEPKQAEKHDEPNKKTRSEFYF